MNEGRKNLAQPLHRWTNRRKISFRFVMLYVLLFMLTLSFPHPFIPDLPAAIAPFFERIAKWAGDHIFHIQYSYTSKIISDSTGLYIHLLVLLVFSAAITLIWTIIDKRRSSYYMLSYWFRVLVSYYLGFYLLWYGFNKIFKWQFYLPEPNTLFTTVGNSYRDILYWSTMGSSHSYSVFLGIGEILAGLLLFFRRTRLAGSLIGFAIMINVAAINFSFDISVKVFSLFLLLLCIVIAAPHLKRLYVFFFTNQAVTGKPWEPNYFTKPTKRFYIAGKVLLTSFLLCSLLAIYVRTGNYNDDRAKRPLFHGAYDVTLFVSNNDTLAPLSTDTYRWKRVFIHRRDYFIIQAMNDEMQDYGFLCDTARKEWFIKKEGGEEEATLHYLQTSDSTISLTTQIGNKALKINIQKIDLSKLPLLKQEFNWTID